MREPLVYLASCYSVGGADDDEKERRFRHACEVTARLMQEGYIVFCPIAHSHPLAVFGALPGDWAFWQRQDMAMLERCDALWVLMMPMWEQSTGITAEIAHAEALGIPVRYLEDTATK